ncbi:zinc ribbon domain-containing protein [Gordonibacter urolithinfaciens]|uniref:zinc ribbon domain-containing protein n=1 Tax=Gordonibacter urolithinfaciens TaxID=1335613 RepID=UPI001E16053D|nr:zinc ribbon domain-containing protein [Gordonibacter urolithinfaciens]HJF62552.1 helix-turn-helix domain-containing protein [Gordonibacter urolithinfaciens]
MSVGETLARMRRERNLTQEDVARRLYVTRQAVSRWETGETEPGVDMCKLIAATFDMPLMELLEMPDGDYCQSCGMPFYQDADHGSEAGGGRSRDFCSMCYEDGAFVRDETMEELIEQAAPHMAAASRISRDEAVSFMGALLPHLKRWEQGQDR